MFFINWHRSDIEQQDNGGRQQQQGKTSPAKVTIKNLAIAAFGFVAVARETIIQEGSCVGKNINQNQLEHFFGKLRDHCGSDRCPTAAQVLRTSRALSIGTSVSKELKATRNPGLADMSPEEAKEQRADNVAALKAPLSRKAAPVDRPGEAAWSEVIHMSMQDALAIVAEETHLVETGQAPDPFRMEALLNRTHFGRTLGDLADPNKTPTDADIAEVWRLIKEDMLLMPNQGPSKCAQALDFEGLDVGAKRVVAGLLKKWRHVAEFKQQRALYQSDKPWWTKGQRQSTTKRLKKGYSRALACMNERNTPGWIRKLFQRVNVRHTPDLTPGVKNGLFFTLWRRLFFEIFLYDLHRHAVLPEKERGLAGKDWRRGTSREQLDAKLNTKDAAEVQEHLAGWVVRTCDVGMESQSSETRFFVDAMDVDTERVRTAHPAVLKFLSYLEGQLRYKYLNAPALWLRGKDTVRFAEEELASSKQLRARWLQMLVELQEPLGSASQKRPASTTCSATSDRAVAYANTKASVALLRQVVDKYLNSRVPRWAQEIQNELVAETKAHAANRCVSTVWHGCGAACTDSRSTAVTAQGTAQTRGEEATRPKARPEARPEAPPQRAGLEQSISCRSSAVRACTQPGARQAQRSVSPSALPC